jgi:membrane protein implicated in regulation of membrane protease activity
MDWWLWILLGFALLALEVTTPGGFYSLFFGFAALITGGLAVAGIVAAPSLQWLVFSLLAVASLLLLRGRLVEGLTTPGTQLGGPEQLVGEAAVLLADLAPGGTSKAELRGTSWSVRSRSTEFLPRGQRCCVERVEGLTLWVRPE